MGARLRSILHWTGKNITWLLLAVSVVFFGLTWMEMGQSSDISKAAASVEKRLERLEKRMDRYAGKVLDMPASQWADIGKVPDYMVIYKYVRDTLHSWINHFPLRNDEIIDGDRFGVRYNRLSRVQTLFMPLLSGVGDTPVYLNMGSQWYLVRSYEKGKVKLICGILVKGDESRILSSFPDVNPKLKLPDNMTIYPVASADGRTVSLHGTPVFNLAYRPGAFPEDGHVHSPFKWITVFLALAAVFSYYVGRRNIFTFLLFMGAVAVSAVLTFNWAADMRNYSGLFSPVVYADSSLHASLGSLLLNNLYVFIVALAVFVSRKRLMLWYSKHNRLCRLSYIAVLAVFAVSLVLYIHFSIKSVVFNSSIVLELFRLDELSAYSILVYFSYLMLFMSLLFMIQLFLPLVTGNRLTIFNVRFILRYSLCISLYFMAAITAFSHAKEISMARAWSNKLAVEIGLDKLVKYATRSSSHNSYMYGNAFEAFIGAIYLDQGYEKTKAFIENYILPHYVDIQTIVHEDHNYKSRLIEWVQKYKVHMDIQTVPANPRQTKFICSISLNSKLWGQGVGTSKKEAEQKSAAVVLRKIEEKKSQGKNS